MSSYLRFFELERSPFDGSGQTQVVLGTRAVREAFAAIRAGVEAGDSRICVSGAAGMGKTSLARALPKLLGDAARVAVVPDPAVGWDTVRAAIARQWGLEAGGLARPALLAIRAEGPLVLVIDQAERADDDFLDHLDVLLCYRTPQDEPVVQSVMMARLSNGDGTATATPLHWWLDRIHTLQLEFAPLPLEGVATYIERHLRRAGWRGAALFDGEAAAAIHGYTGGVPGAISDLCERLLIEAASRALESIDARFVEDFCESPAASSAAAPRAVAPAATNRGPATPEPGDSPSASVEDRDAIAAAMAAALPASPPPDRTDAEDAAGDERAEAATEIPSEQPFEAATETAGEEPFEAETQTAGETEVEAEATPYHEGAGDAQADASDAEAEPITLELVEPADGTGADPVGTTAAEPTAATSPPSEIDLEAALEYFEGAAASALGTGGFEAGPRADAPDDASAEPTGDAISGDATDDGDDAACEADADTTGDAGDAAIAPDAAIADDLPWHDDEMDAALLLAPPSEKEMRALRGPMLQRFARPVAGAIAAVVIGGVGLSLVSGDEPPASGSQRQATMLPQESSPASERAERASPPALADYARDRESSATTGPVLFAPGPGFVTPEPAVPATRPDAADAAPKPMPAFAARNSTRAATTGTPPKGSDDTMGVVLETSPSAAERSAEGLGDAATDALPASPSPGTREDR